MPRCPGCPIAGEAESPCDPARDWPGWCGRIAGEAHQPERARYWSGRIFDEADRLSKAGPVRRPMKVPDGFPSASPRKNRVRAGVISPSCYLGGADIWTGDLLRHTDHSRIQWVGAAIRDDAIPITPEVRASWAAHCPVAVGPAAIRALAAACDVVIAWGVFQSWGFPAGGLAGLIGDTRLIYVSHGSLSESLVPSNGLLSDAIPVGVSRASLNGMPEEFRGRAVLIPNVIAPERVRTTRTREDMRASLGIPEGGKVAGYLGRFAGEKRPRVLIDAMAHLPAGWTAVMAGIGYSLEADIAHAESVAPGRVKFLGARYDIGDLLSAFDCLCMPSQTEACSLSANEAWLAGCPLISTGVGTLEPGDRPDLARIVPNPPTGADLATAILADDADRDGTGARAGRAREYARRELSAAAFRASWTEMICRAAPGRPAAPIARPAATRPAIDPAVRNAVLGCPHRGVEGSLKLLPEETSCCGSGEERTPCALGRGQRPGRTTLRECLACKTAELSLTRARPG